VTACSVPREVTTSTCTGTETTQLGTATIGTPLALVLANGEIAHLRFRFVLLDQDEVSVNGAPPATTFQGATVPITASLRIDERAPIDTSS